MRKFKHYIITRFNLGLYSPGARIGISPDEWMRHRVKIFTEFTLPSVMAQRCQDFTWLVLFDSRTPQEFYDILYAFGYPNMKLLWVDVSNQEIPVSHDFLSNLVKQIVEPGDYDLITTRVDNDDAIRNDVISIIHEWYVSKPYSWTIKFPLGYLLDLNKNEIFQMQYWVNNCVTLIEGSLDARTVYCAGHTTLSADAMVAVGQKPRWIQIVHSENIANTSVDSGSRVVYRDKPVTLSDLAEFGIDPAGLPDLNKHIFPTAQRPA